VRIGPYEVVRELGRGGMGVVYEVRHPEAPRRLALKVILDDEAKPDELERFRREARLLARVRHPSIVVVHALDRTEDGRDYLVTDLVEGESLGRAARQRPLEPRRSATIVRDLALAVEEVHRNGILHRDLKPDNVILTPEGVPVLLDFGLARDDSAERLTRSGVVLGTLAYMPPEQAAGARATKLDERADVYALGATLFFLLAGAPPFDGATTASLLYAVLEKEPEWPAGAPRDLVAIGKKAMAKYRGARYARAAALAADLDLFVQGRRPAAARRSRAPRVAAVVAAVVLAAGAALALAHRGAAPPPTALASPVATPSGPPTTAVADDRPPPDDLAQPLSAYRRQRAWVRAHPGNPDALKLARRLETRAQRHLAACKFARRAKCFWVGATTLLVLTQENGGLYVIDMDKPSPLPQRLPRVVPNMGSCFSGALHRREGSVRWVVGGENVYVIEGDPRAPNTMIGREAFVFPDSAEPLSPPDHRRVMAMAISPDGKTAAAGGDWRTAYLIDLEHPGAPARPFRPEHGDKIASLAFAGGCLLVGNEKSDTSDPGLYVFDLATDKQVFNEPFQSGVMSIALARDGRFALGRSDGGILVRTPDSTETVALSWPMREWNVRDDLSQITGLAFVDRGARLVAVSGANAPGTKGSRLFMRSSRSPDEPARLLAEDLDAMVSLDVSEDERLVAIGGEDGAVEVFAMPD
jgi:predicted Ser/Thr protein kinase